MKLLNQLFKKLKIIKLTKDDESIKYLIKARKLLSDPDKWIKYHLYAKFDSKYKQFVETDIYEAKIFCAEGAIRKVCRGNNEIAISLIYFLIELLKKEGYNFCNLAAFNDHCSTKHSDVLAFFDRAICLVKKEGLSK